MRVLDNGVAEPLKACVHGALGALVTLCVGYNALAFLRRRERHLAFNTVVYTVLAVWEWTHVRHHRAPSTTKEP